MYIPTTAILAGESEIAYVEFNGSVTISATAEATPNDIVTSGALSYEGKRICIEFYAAEMETGAVAGSFLLLNLWDSVTNVGRIAVLENASATVTGVSVLVKRYLTPTAASHEYSVKGWRVNSNGTVSAGTGGTAALPGYIRVTRMES